MSFTVICIDVRCDKYPVGEDPVYRIFFDEQLVIERKFWPTAPDYYIQEQLTLEDDDQTHTVRIKNVFPSRGEIYMHELNFFDGDNKTPLRINYDHQNDVYSFRIAKR